MENKKLRTALFLHIVLVVLEMIDTNFAYGKRGMGMLIHYTEDSNLLCLVVSALFTLVMLPIIFKGQTNGFVSTFLMRNYKKDETKKVTIPTWLLLLRYVTTCCLLVTFVVVLLVLAPEDGYHAMFLEGTHLINHLGAPLLSLYIFLGQRLCDSGLCAQYLKALCGTVLLLSRVRAATLENHFLDRGDSWWKCSHRTPRSDDL